MWLFNRFEDSARPLIWLDGLIMDALDSMFLELSKFGGGVGRRLNIYIYKNKKKSLLTL